MRVCVCVCMRVCVCVCGLTCRRSCGTHEYTGVAGGTGGPQCAAGKCRSALKKLSQSRSVEELGRKGEREGGREGGRGASELERDLSLSCLLLTRS